MDIEEAKRQVLEALTNGTLQPTQIVFGDNVQTKVEAGGIGNQTINHYHNNTSSLPIPEKGDYKAVRSYIEMRLKQDPFFKNYYYANSRIDLCQLLTDEFGWDVNDHSLTVNLGRNPIR